ncbi:hypothetical protein OIU78_020479 [Salix suchowensis]|nr:hypothetical protein OIU78_020479 [Salix suchowensis]
MPVWTYHGTRLDYAGLCVEVAAEDEYVHSFLIESPLSKAPCKVRVEYEWRPTRCKECNTFGHSCHSQGKLKEKEEQPHKAIATTTDNHQTLSHDIEKSQNPTPHPSAANQKTIIPPNQKKKSQQPPQQKTTNLNLHPDTVQQEGQTDTTHQPDIKSSENVASEQRQMKHTTHKQTNPKKDKALAKAKQKEAMIQDHKGTKGDEMVDENTTAGLQNKMDSLQSRTSRHTEEDHAETSSSRRSEANALIHSDDLSAQPVTAVNPCRILVGWNPNKLLVDNVRSEEQWLTCEKTDMEGIEDGLGIMRSSDRVSTTQAFFNLRIPGLDSLGTMVSKGERYPTEAGLGEDRKRGGHFKFLNLWVDRHNFMDIIKDNWNQNLQGSPMMRLSANLYRVKEVLKK